MFGAEDRQLPAHAAGARRRRNVRGYGKCFEIFVALRNSLSKGYALGAGSNRVGSVLDVSPTDVTAELGEDHGANPEPTVRAVCRLFGGNAVPFEGVELL